MDSSNKTLLTKTSVRPIWPVGQSLPIPDIDQFCHISSFYHGKTKAQMGNDLPTVTNIGQT
jgi:hypothetical protein